MILNWTTFNEGRRIFSEISKDMPANIKSLWSQEGDKVFYRGVDIFELVNSKEVQEQFFDCITCDEDIQKEDNFDKGSYQEVYLGYVPEYPGVPQASDRFYIGFDVFTETVKSVLLGFRIENDNGVGKIGWSRQYGTSLDLQLDDASFNLFYSPEAHSIYRGISSFRQKNGPGSWIDLRLD